MRLGLAAIPVLVLATAPCPGAAAEFIAGVTCVATSEQAPGYIAAANLVRAENLEEMPPGSGRFRLHPKARQWNSQYGVVGKQANDESPIVQFDLQKVARVAGFRVWNLHAGGYSRRGFREVSVQVSSDGRAWTMLPQRFQFALAPGMGDYFGEEHRFAVPLAARYIRFWCHGTWRGPYGQPDVAGLGQVRFLAAPEAPPDPADAPPTAAVFPADCGVIDVRQAPYFARGDGQTDDTAALQRAIDDWQASRQQLYLPAGVYVVSKTLKYQPGRLHGDNNLRGDGPGKTVLRLADGVFTDAKLPRPVLTFGFHGPEGGGRVSADWFNNNIRDLTIDVGRGNPGAIALQFYSNNAGAARNLVLRSGDGQGAIGLDLAYADQNGPLLVRGLKVEGFALGVSCGNSVNSQTLVDLELAGQTEAAFQNAGQCVSIHRLKATGPAPFVRHNWGFLTLVDGELTATGPAAAQAPAVTSGEILWVRDLQTSGFARAVESKHPEPSVATGPKVDEFASLPIANLFESPRRSLRLPLEAAPRAQPSSAIVGWANVRNFRRIEETDDTAAIQRAFDSGDETVYFPSPGGYLLTAPLVVPPSVRHIVGYQSQWRALRGAAPALRIAEGDQPLTIDGLNDVAEVVNESQRPLIIRDIQGINLNLRGAGPVWLENVVGDVAVGAKQRVWAWQLNSERAGTKITNAGHLWIVGLKTERGGTLIATQPGGKTELLGGLCYTTNQGKLAPMFAVHDGDFFGAIGEVCYTGDPFATLVEERRGELRRTLLRAAAPKRFAFLQGSAVLYASGK